MALLQSTFKHTCTQQRYTMLTIFGVQFQGIQRVTANVYF